MDISKILTESNGGKGMRKLPEGNRKEMLKQGLGWGHVG